MQAPNKRLGGWDPQPGLPDLYGGIRSERG
jgi:hypothetical protein